MYKVDSWREMTYSHVFARSCITLRFLTFVPDIFCEFIFEWELIWVALGNLNDSGRSRSLSEAREANFVDSGGAVNGRIELASCIIMISRLSRSVSNNR